MKYLGINLTKCVISVLQIYKIYKKPQDTDEGNQRWSK